MNIQCIRRLSAMSIVSLGLGACEAIQVTGPEPDAPAIVAEAGSLQQTEQPAHALNGEDESVPATAATAPVIAPVIAPDITPVMTPVILLPAITQRVLTPRPLPPELDVRVVSVKPGRALDFPRLANVVADTVGYPVVIEERLARNAAEHTALSPAPEIYLEFEGGVRDLFNRLGDEAGYEWGFRVTEGSGAEFFFYRYHDEEWASAGAGTGTVRDGPWRVDPVQHKTLKGVIHQWSQTAGWHLVWEAGDVDFDIEARSSFEGSFEEAVDALLADTRKQIPLVAKLYPANRYVRIMRAEDV